MVRLDHLAADDHGWITSAYHLTREIRAHLESLERSLLAPSGTGLFVIGPYGSGKSHFLAYVVEALRTGTLAAGGPEVVALSLVNYRGDTPLEDIICRALGVEVGGGDRRLAWSALSVRHPRGLLLVLDELSEFLRSKPDPPRFNEDARFLQYLGEWAAGGKFWVLAAMQEAIEHTGVLERGLYRKIKDRFPLRLLLGTSHVRDLVRDAVLVKKEGYDEAVGRLAREIRSALAGVALDEPALRAVYPLHPSTLELLDEVRDRFSAARGVIDFTVTRLAGDPARHVEPFLDRPLGDLLTPDTIVDHFRDLLEIQPEFLPLAERVFPYLRKRVPELFPSPDLQGLAERLLKLLVLVHLAPDRSGLTAAEAAGWLLFRPSRLDPAKNRGVVERVLEKLRAEGRFVVRTGDAYHLDLEDDGAAELERLLEREKAELAGRGDALFEELASVLEKSVPTPFALPRERWQPRDVRWHFHERRIAVYLGEEPPPRLEEAPALCVRLPWGADDSASGVFTLRPAPLSPGPEVMELVAVERLRERRWSPQAAARLESLARDRLEILKTRIRSAYLDAQVTAPNSPPEPAPRVDPSLPLARWIEGYAEWMLRRTYPSFERFAPSHGPLPKEAYRSYVRFASDPDRREDQADDHVKIVREGYLVPMALMQRKGRDYLPHPRLESHELVRLVVAMLERSPAPSAIYERLAAPVYGLVPDQTGLLLVFLALEGHLEIVKEGRSYRELFETLPNPLQYDRIGPAHALRAEELAELRRLAEGFHVRVPAQWTVPAQRQLAAGLRELGSAHSAELRGLLEKLESMGSDRALADQISEVLKQWSVLDQGAEPLKALQQFLHEIGSAARFLSRAASFAELPARIDKVLGELRRYHHVLHHPVLAAAPDEAARIRFEALGEPPSLKTPEAVQEWLGRAEAVYRDYKEEYCRRHDAWWRDWRDHPLAAWRPPLVARSRHLGLAAELAGIEELRLRAQRLRCPSLVNLDFQPVCACAFDGEASPLRDVVAELGALRERVERELGLFFRQDAIRSRVRAWAAEGLEAGPGVSAYLEGKAPFPEVQEVELLDRHLAGADLVAELDAAALAGALGGRTWERRELVKAFEEWLDQFGEKRLRFAKPVAKDHGGAALWCVEQALRFGVSLPRGFRAEEREAVREGLRAEWVGADALSRLEDLGLPEEAEDRLLGWIVDGTLAPPARDRASPLVRVALELVRPSTPATPGELARLAADLYRCHPRMMRVARGRWLERLESLAGTALADSPPPLMEALRAHASVPWVVIDAFGIQLLDMLAAELAALFPAWRLESASFALAPGATTTDAFYRELAAAGTRHPIEKVNTVDRLLHERFLAFDDLCRLAATELRIACRSLRSTLDAERPLLLFADHGFRIAPDGGSYLHGGGSTLERLVPLWLLVPELRR